MLNYVNIFLFDGSESMFVNLILDMINSVEYRLVYIDLYHRLLIKK